MCKLRVRPQKGTCSEDVHTVVTLATDTHENSQKLFFSHIHFFCSGCWFVCICRFRLQTLSIKLQLQIQLWLLSFSVLQQLMMNVCWWMERLVSGKACCSTRNTQISAEAVQITDMNICSMKRLYYWWRDAYILLHMENSLNKKPQIESSHTFWLNIHIPACLIYIAILEFRLLLELKYCIVLKYYNPCYRGTENDPKHVIYVTWSLLILESTKFGINFECYKLLPYHSKNL